MISEALIEELRLGLMLALLLLNRLFDRPPEAEAEIEDPLDELPKIGEDGATEAGVAINVGVISLRVIIATVVRVLERRLVLGLLRVGLNRLGLITGVNVRLGFVNVERDGALFEDPLIELFWGIVVDESEEGSRVVESTNSVSKFSILIIELDANVGVLEADGSS